jgi:Putative MetA-pathway of phenol degradation
VVFEATARRRRSVCEAPTGARGERAGSETYAISNAGGGSSATPRDRASQETTRANCSLGIASRCRTAILLLVAQVTAWAGPPFRTDDPIPTPYRHGEAYLFSAGQRSAEGAALTAAPGVEFNYSLLPDTFLHSVVPFGYNDPKTGAPTYGLGDIELGFKWHFIHASGRLPDVGVFPLVEVPTGDRKRGLGNGVAQYFFPLWLQKDWGPWTLYGGGGYWINPGAGNKDWWFSGVLLQRQVTARLYLGAELFHQTPDTADSRRSTGFNAGGSYDLGSGYQVLFSAGRNVQDVASNRFSYYVAFYRVF